MILLTLTLLLLFELPAEGNIEEIREILLPKVRKYTYNPVGVCSQGLSKLARDGDCQYYRCLEDGVRCTDKGYPAGYGQRYCNNLDQVKPNLSPQGQTWVQNFKRCTMEKLNGYLHNMIKSCETIGEVALHSHLDCLPGEAEASLCHVAKDPAEHRHLVDVFRGEGQDNDHVVHQVMQAARSCVHQNYQRAELGDKNRLQTNVEALINQLRTLLPAASISAEETSPDRMNRCEEYSQQGDCRFYECLHERFPCGSDATPDHLLHFEMVTCQMFQTHSKLSPAKVAQSWALEHQKCLMKKLLPLYKRTSLECGHVHTLLFNERPSCYHTPQVLTCRMNGDDMALMLDRALDLESYPVATLRKMMYMSDADREVLLPTYYYRQTALLRVQLGDVLCTCRQNAAQECGPLHTQVYNSDAEVAQFIMDKQSGYTSDDGCTIRSGRCQLTSRACKGLYEEQLCSGATNRLCCLAPTSGRAQICESNPDNRIRGSPDCGGPGWWDAPRDWGTHRAIDIACTEGDAVLAPLSGRLMTTSRPPESCQGVDVLIGIRAEEAVSIKYVKPDANKLLRLVQRGERIGVHVACNITLPCSTSFVTLTHWKQGAVVDPTPEYGGPVILPTTTTTTTTVSPINESLTTATP